MIEAKLNNFEIKSDKTKWQSHLDTLFDKGKGFRNHETKSNAERKHKMKSKSKLIKYNLS